MNRRIWSLRSLPLIVLWFATVLASGTAPTGAESRSDVRRGSEVVAVWNGGGATFAELESGVAGTQTQACQGSNLGAWSGNPDGVVACFGDVARRIAIEDVVLQEIPDLSSVVARRGDPPGALLRRAYANTWSRWYAEKVDGQISESDILIYYETHRDRFRQGGSVELWNIFLRDDDQGRREDTEAELLELKAQIEAGASFEKLARKYSQSETRVRGGLVGTVTRGQLSPDLDAVVFGLKTGEISEPLRVAGGAVILQVRRVNGGGDLPLDMVRERVAGQIAAERRAAAVAEIVRDVAIPENSIVLSRNALMTALDGADLDAPVLAVYDTELTVRELRDRERLDLGSRVSGLGKARQESLWADYVTIKNGALLGAALVEVADPKLRKAAEAVALENGARTIVAEILRNEVEPGPVDEEILRRHFDENRDRFRFALQLKLRICEAPFGDDPMQQSAEMDGAYTGLAEGSMNLGEVCAGSGGHVKELDWATPEELRRRLSAKSMALVRRLDVGGLTVPFQQGQSIVIVELVDRRPPREMSFEEARDQVSKEVAAILLRKEVRRAADERLGAAGFRFDEDRVRAMLALSPSPPPSQ